jgi:hypothetical protein
VAAACASTFIVAPAANGAQGSDSITRGDHISYIADPGEANRLVIEDWTSGGLHLNDSGAIIRWIGAPVPGAMGCTGALHDAYCVGGGGGFAVHAKLGDGDDTYTVLSATTTDVDLGPGNDIARGGGLGDAFEGGPGADDMGGGDGTDGWGDSVTYEHATGPVRVDADNVADDGEAGEGDNVRSDIELVTGGPFGDRLSGFGGMDGGPGNDVIVAPASGGGMLGGAGDDLLVGGAGPDSLSDVADPSGSNTFLARGGGSDHIVCGYGYDRVFADASDTIETRTGWPACEEVSIG